MGLSAEIHKGNHMNLMIKFKKYSIKLLPDSFLKWYCASLRKSNWDFLQESCKIRSYQKFLARILNERRSLASTKKYCKILARILQGHLRNFQGTSKEMSDQLYSISSSTQSSLQITRREICDENFLQQSQFWIEAEWQWSFLDSVWDIHSNILCRIKWGTEGVYFTARFFL